MLPTWVKVTKCRFNEIRSMITKGNESGLVTTIGKKRITLSGTKKLVDDIISGKINKSDARKIYNDIADGVNARIALNATKN